MTVYAIEQITIAVDFGADHAIDEGGTVHCVLGPGVLIRDGVRTTESHGFRLYFGQQHAEGPQLRCLTCGRPAPISLIHPDRLPGP